MLTHFALYSIASFIVIVAVLTIFYSYRLKKQYKMLKRFLLLTGISAGAFIVSVLLHNAIYGLFIEWFGADFWDRIGLGDEPFFFIIAVILCPIAFLVGAVGSIVFAIKKFRTAK